MTTRHVFARSLVALSAFVALASGGAPTSTARAETRSQIVVSESSIDCPACEVLKTYDRDGLAFRDVVVEVQNGNQIVITAEVAVAATAGKPRTASVVFSAFADRAADGRFMDYTDDACMPSAMSRAAGDQACAAISHALTTTEGIIMRDGGVCDPIRHMGC
jgi:hypothetical protein